MDRRVVGAALSLSVTTIGAGVLALPAAFESDGTWLVTVTLAVVAALTFASLDFLVLCIAKLEARSYEEIADALLGSSFKQFIRWLLIVYNCGTAVGYLVVLGDIFSPMLPRIQTTVPYISTPQHLIIVLWTGIMLPLSCVPRVSSLHYTSALAIAATFFVSGVIVYRYFAPVTMAAASTSQHTMYRDGHAHHRHDTASHRTSDGSLERSGGPHNHALLALPVLMFAFDCQSLVFQIYAGMEGPTRSLMARTAALSVCVTSLVYGAVGYFGYASNTPNVHGNVLTNYDPLKDHLIAVGEASYAITLILAYVLILIPCRDAIFQLMYGYSHTHAELKIPTYSNAIVSVLLSFLCLCLALLAPGFCTSSLSWAASAAASSATSTPPCFASGYTPSVSPPTPAASGLRWSHCSPSASPASRWATLHLRASCPSSPATSIASRDLPLISFSIHTHVHIQIHSYTHIHIYVHTYIYIYICDNVVTSQLLVPFTAGFVVTV